MITWRVLRHCKFVGYVQSPSMFGAQFLAADAFGTGCIVERYA